MREPTPNYVLYAWHHDAMSGRKPPVHDDEPQCGWFETRLVKAGPWVPAVIWMHQEVDDADELVEDEVLRCEICDKRADPYEAWVWLCSHPITKARFDYLLRERRDAGWYGWVNHPLFDPYKPVDLLTMKPIF